MNAIFTSNKFLFFSIDFKFFFSKTMIFWTSNNTISSIISIKLNHVELTYEQINMLKQGATSMTFFNKYSIVMHDKCGLIVKIYLVIHLKSFINVIAYELCSFFLSTLLLRYTLTLLFHWTTS